MQSLFGEKKLCFHFKVSKINEENHHRNTEGSSFIEAKTLRLERESWAECRKQPYIRAMLPTGQTCWIQSLFIHYIPACIGLARLPDAFNPDWNHAHKVAKKSVNAVSTSSTPLNLKCVENVQRCCQNSVSIYPAWARKWGFSLMDTWEDVELKNMKK